MKKLLLVFVGCVFSLPAMAQTDSYILKDDGSSGFTTSTLIYEDDTNDRIGIGTTAPDAELHIAGKWKLKKSGKKFVLHPNYSAADTHASIHTAGSSDMRLQLGTNQTSYIMIDTDGDVGINVGFAPSDRLEVAGGHIEVSTPGYGIKMEESSADTRYRLYVDDSGAIGTCVDACTDLYDDWCSPGGNDVFIPGSCSGTLECSAGCGTGTCLEEESPGLLFELNTSSPGRCDEDYCAGQPCTFPDHANAEECYEESGCLKMWKYNCADQYVGVDCGNFEGMRGGCSCQ